MFESISLWEVLVATIAAFALGALWYGPLFGKYWMGLMGYTPDNVKSMAMTPTKAMVLGFISTLITAYVVALFVGMLNITSASEALIFTFWAWLGYTATVIFGSVLWENRSVKLFLFNAVYHFVSYSLMALIIALWS